MVSSKQVLWPKFEERRMQRNELKITGGVGICEDSKFIIQSKLGEGEYSTTLRCLHVETMKRYAVKICPCNTAKEITNQDLRSTANQRLLEDMKREYRLGTRAKHPNIVKNYGYGQDQDGDLCLVMELQEGGNFSELLTSNSMRKRIDDTDYFRYVDQLVSAVAHIHS